jgi:hypothetical protein
VGRANSGLNPERFSSPGVAIIVYAGFITNLGETISFGVSLANPNANEDKVEFFGFFLNFLLTNITRQFNMAVD